MCIYYGDSDENTENVIKIGETPKKEHHLGNNRLLPLSCWPHAKKTLNFTQPGLKSDANDRNSIKRRGEVYTGSKKGGGQ